MQTEIFSVFKKNLLTKGIAKFGALYKRQTLFDWEKETRLLFNWGFYQSELAQNSFSVFTHNSKNYIEIPFDNNLFTLKLKSVTIGKNITLAQKQSIKDLTDRKGIKWTEEK